DVGEVSLDVRHTPGHTPEHIAFVVTDRAVSDRPLGMLSGDFIFVGDVGRPDLLERAANARGTADALARRLFHSVRETESLPDFLQVWPGHGAGSACGKALGALPSSTLGYERLANWAFQIADEVRFVREALAGQSPPPSAVRSRWTFAEAPRSPPSTFRERSTSRSAAHFSPGRAGFCPTTATSSSSPTTRSVWRTRAGRSR